MIIKDKTSEEKIEQVKELRPIDDVFFEVLAENPGVCEEILRVIMNDEGLVVESVIVQSSKRNIYGRSVRLDTLCILSSGKRVNIEVQRSDNDDHLRRVRFNSASITVKDSQIGGAVVVCEVMERYQAEAVSKADREASIRTLVESYCDFDASRETIINKLISKFQLTETEASAKYEQYAPSLK